MSQVEQNITMQVTCVYVISIPSRHRSSMPLIEVRMNIGLSSHLFVYFIGNIFMMWFLIVILLLIRKGEYFASQKNKFDKINVLIDT